MANPDNRQYSTQLFSVHTRIAPWQHLDFWNKKKKTWTHPTSLRAMAKKTLIDMWFSDVVRPHLVLRWRLLGSSPGKKWKHRIPKSRVTEPPNGPSQHTVAHHLLHLAQERNTGAIKWDALLLQCRASISIYSWLTRSVPTASAHGKQKASQSFVKLVRTSVIWPCRAKVLLQDRHDDPPSVR